MILTKPTLLRLNFRQEARALQRRLQALLGDSVPEGLEAGEESTLSETFTVYDFDESSAQSLNDRFGSLLEPDAAVKVPESNEQKSGVVSTSQCLALPTVEEEVQEPPKPATAAAVPHATSVTRAKQSPLELLRQRQAERQRARQKTSANTSSGSDHNAETIATTNKRVLSPVDASVRPELPRAYLPAPTSTVSTTTSRPDEDGNNANVRSSGATALYDHSASPTPSSEPLEATDNHCSSPASIPSAATESSPGGQSVRTYDSTADDDDDDDDDDDKNSAGTRPDDSPRSPRSPRCDIFQMSSPTLESSISGRDKCVSTSLETAVDTSETGSTTQSAGTTNNATPSSRGLGPLSGELGSSPHQPLPATSLFGQCAPSHQDWLLNGSAVYPLALRVAVLQLRLLPPEKAPYGPSGSRSDLSVASSSMTDHRGLPGPAALAASALAASRREHTAPKRVASVPPLGTLPQPTLPPRLLLKPPAMRPLVMAVKSYGGGRPLTARGSGRVPIGRPVQLRDGTSIGQDGGGSRTIDTGDSSGSDDGNDAHSAGSGSVPGAEAVVMVRSPTESLSLELIDDGRTPEVTMSSSLVSPQSSPPPVRYRDCLGSQLEVAQAATAAPPPPPPCAWRAVVAGIELPLALPPPLEPPATSAPSHPDASAGKFSSRSSSLLRRAAQPAAVAWTGWVVLQDRCELPPGGMLPLQQAPSDTPRARRFSVRGREAQEAAAAEAADLQARLWRGVLPWRLVAKVSLSWDPFQSARRRSFRPSSWPLMQLSLPLLGPQPPTQLSNPTEADALPGLRLFVMVDRVEGLPPLSAVLDSNYGNSSPLQQQQGGYAPDLPVASVAGKAWSCARCTFRNPPSTSECHMCGEAISPSSIEQNDVGRGFRSPRSDPHETLPVDTPQIFTCNSIACRAVLAWVARDGTRRPASPSSSSSTSSSTPPSSVLASSTMRQRRLARRLKRQHEREAVVAAVPDTQDVVPVAAVPDGVSRGGGSLRDDEDINYGGSSCGAVLECCLPGELWPEENPDLGCDVDDDDRNNGGRDHNRAQARWQQLQQRYTSRRGHGSSSSSGSGTLALDVKGSSRRGGARAILWPARGSANQLWTFDTLSGGRLSPRHAPHLALDLRGGCATNGAPVVVWPYQAVAEPNQHWKLMPNGLMACRALPEQPLSTKSGYGPPPATASPPQPWVLGLRRSEAAAGCRSGTSRFTLPADARGVPWGPWCGAELVLVAANSPRALRWRWSSVHLEASAKNNSTRSLFYQRSTSCLSADNSESQKSVPSSRGGGARHWGEVRSAVASGQFRTNSEASSVDAMTPTLVHIGSAPPLPAWEVLPSTQDAEGGHHGNGNENDDNAEAQGLGDGSNCGGNNDGNEEDDDDDEEEDELAQHDATVAALEKQLAKARRVGETEVASALAANLRDLLEVGETLALEQHAKQVERVQKKQEEALQRLAREEQELQKKKQKRIVRGSKDRNEAPTKHAVDTNVAHHTPEFSRTDTAEMESLPNESPLESLPATPQTPLNRKQFARSKGGGDDDTSSGNQKTNDHGNDLFFANAQDNFDVSGGDLLGGCNEDGGLGDSDWSGQDSSDCGSSDEGRESTPDLDELVGQLSAQLTKARRCGEAEIAEQLEADLHGVQRAKQDVDFHRQSSARSAGSAAADRHRNKRAAATGGDSGQQRQQRVPVLSDGRGFTAVWPQPTRPTATVSTDTAPTTSPSAFLSVDVGGTSGGRHGETLELTLVEAPSGKLVAGPTTLPWECTCRHNFWNDGRFDNDSNNNNEHEKASGRRAEAAHQRAEGGNLGTVGEACECGSALFTSWRSRPHSIPLKVRMPPVLSRACMNTSGAPAHRTYTTDTHEIAASTDDGSTSSAASSQASRYQSEHERDFDIHGERRRHGSNSNSNINRDSLWATVWMRACWAHEAAPQVRALDAECAAQDRDAWLAAEAVADADAPPPPPPSQSTYSPRRSPRRTPKAQTSSKGIAERGNAAGPVDGYGKLHEEDGDNSDHQQNLSDAESSPSTEDDGSVHHSSGKGSSSDENERTAAACPVKVGDRVCVRDQESDPWESGTVEALGSKGWPVVLVDGWTDAFAFAFYCLESPAAASMVDDFALNDSNPDDAIRDKDAVGNSLEDVNEDSHGGSAGHFARYVNSSNDVGKTGSSSKKIHAGHLNHATWLLTTSTAESADSEVAVAAVTPNDEQPAEVNSVADELASTDSSSDVIVLQDSKQRESVAPENIHPSKDSAQSSEFIEHLVSPTDTCASVCLRYKVKASTLRRLNGFSGDSVWHLRTLRVPNNIRYTSKTSAADSIPPPCMPEPNLTPLVDVGVPQPAQTSSPLGQNHSMVSKADRECFEHQVLPSDTCADICLKYRVKASTLRRLNGFTGDNVHAYSMLQIPCPNPSQLHRDHNPVLPSENEMQAENPVTPPRLSSAQQSPTPNRPQKTPLGAGNSSSLSGSKARIRSPLPISTAFLDESLKEPQGVDRRHESNGEGMRQAGTKSSREVDSNHNQSSNRSRHHNGGMIPEGNNNGKSSKLAASDNEALDSSPAASAGFESPQHEQGRVSSTPTSATDSDIATSPASPAPGSVLGLTQRLSALLKIRANRTCADCSAKRPRWCSTSLGVFLCADCAAAHRALGPEVSMVRSVYASPDSSDGGPWYEADVETMEAWGNARAAAVYEAAVPADYRGRPQANNDHNHEISPSAAARQRLRWAKSKYKHLKFLPPPEAFHDLPPASSPIFNPEEDETTAPLENALMSGNSSEVGPINLERDSVEYCTQVASEVWAQEPPKAFDVAEADSCRAKTGASSGAEGEATVGEVHTLMDDSDLPATKSPSASADPEAIAVLTSTAAPSSRSDPSWYAPGTRVAVKDDVSESWGMGTVGEWPLVRHDGWDEDFEWKFVQPLDAVLNDPAEMVAEDPLSSLAAAAANDSHQLAPSTECCAICGHAMVSGAGGCAHCDAQLSMEWANESSRAEGLRAVPEGDESGEDEDEGSDDIVVGDHHGDRTGVSRIEEEDDSSNDNSDGGVEVLAADEAAQLGPTLIGASDEEDEEDERADLEGGSIENESASESSVSSDPDANQDYDIEDEVQWSWVALEDTDAFSGENALVVPLLGVAAARVIAERQGFGGFAVSRKTVYFRRCRGDDLMNARISKPGTVLHVFAPAEEVAPTTQLALEVHVIGCSGLRVGGAKSARFIGGLRARVAFFSNTGASADTELPPLAAFMGPSRRAAVSVPGAAVPSLAPPLRALGKSVFWAAATTPTPRPATPFPTFEEMVQIEGLSHDSSLVAAVLLSPVDDHGGIPQTPTLAAWARFVPLDSEGLRNGRHWRREVALELTEADGSPGGVLQLLARWI